MATRAPDESAIMNFRQNWKVLALYTLLTGVFTYPVVLHLNSRIMGDGDAWRFCWNMWRMRFSLLQLINPFCSDYIHFPTGACAYLHTWNFPVTLASIPLQSFFSTVSLYNLAALLRRRKKTLVRFIPSCATIPRVLQ